MQDTAELYSKNLSENMLQAYWEDFADYHFFDVQNAIKFHRRDPKAGQYMPKTADLIKILKQEKWHSSKNKFKCRVDFCVETKNLIRIGFDEPAVYWCLKHYDQQLKKCDINLENERRSNNFIEAAKMVRLTNQEYFEQYHGFDVKRAAQVIGGKV